MKTNLDSMFKTNQTLEKDGIIFKYNDTVKFHVRRYGGANAGRVKQAMAKYFKPYARQVELGQLSPEKEHEIFVKTFVEACMINWEGIEIDGQPTPYSPEVANKLFIALPELFGSILNFAQGFDSFKEDLGNS